MHIPFVNLVRLHTNMQPALNQMISEVIGSEYIMGGELLTTFEQDFAAYTGVKHGIACGNCTDALEIILRALHIGPGDEVIVPANGWLSAAEVVYMLGGAPIFVEPDPLLYTIDATHIEQKLTDKTKAIIPIHLYGLPASMEAIMSLAEAYKLWVIEDCAQAHGASIGQKKVGSFGHAAAFSFYPTKNLGALGDGGMILTSDKTLAQRCRAMASHGQLTRNEHVTLGRNSRMDTLQAAVLHNKLPHLDAWNARRIAIAAHYCESWKNLALVLPQNAGEDYHHVYHLFAVQSNHRDALADALKRQGIATAVHYPYALPQMPVFSGLAAPADYPIACQQASQLLSIPIYPELTDGEVEYITERVKAVCKRIG